MTGIDLDPMSNDFRRLCMHANIRTEFFGGDPITVARSTLIFILMGRR